MIKIQGKLPWTVPTVRSRQLVFALRVQGPRTKRPTPAISLWGCFIFYFYFFIVKY